MACKRVCKLALGDERTNGSYIQTSSRSFIPFQAPETDRLGITNTLIRMRSAERDDGCETTGWWISYTAFIHASIEQWIHP